MAGPGMVPHDTGEPLVLVFPPNAAPIAVTLILLGYLLIHGWVELRKPPEPWEDS